MGSIAYVYPYRPTVRRPAGQVTIPTFFGASAPTASPVIPNFQNIYTAAPAPVSLPIPTPTASPQIYLPPAQPSSNLGLWLLFGGLGVVAAVMMVK